jgi:hypothetical protein
MRESPTTPTGRSLLRKSSGDGWSLIVRIGPGSNRNGGPDVLRYEDVPDPECPDGHVVVDVEAISIDGGDLLHRAGAELPSVPDVVGYLAAGTISDVGAASRSVRSATASSP